MKKTKPEQLTVYHANGLVLLQVFEIPENDEAPRNANAALSALGAERLAYQLLAAANELRLDDPSVR